MSSPKKTSSKSSFFINKSSPMKKTAKKKSSSSKLSLVKKVNSKMNKSPVKNPSKTNNLDSIVDQLTKSQQSAINAKKKSSSSKLSPVKKINSKMKKTSKSTNLDTIVGKLTQSQQSAINAKKKKKCGTCDNCKMANCGNCVTCKDMKSFGGEGKMKQACKMRKCVYIDSAAGTSKQISSTSILSSPTTSRNKSSAVQLKKKVSFLSSVSSTSVSTKSPSVSASSLLTPKPPPPGVRHDYRTLDLEQTIKRKKILACSSSSLELQQPPRKKVVHILSPVPSSPPVSKSSTTTPPMRTSRPSSSILPPHMSASEEDVTPKPRKRRKRILACSSSSLELQQAPRKKVVHILSPVPSSPPVSTTSPPMRTSRPSSSSSILSPHMSSSNEDVTPKPRKRRKIISSSSLFNVDEELPHPAFEEDTNLPTVTPADAPPKVTTSSMTSPSSSITPGSSPTWTPSYINGRKKPNSSGFVQILLDPNGYQMSYHQKSFGRKFYYCKMKETLDCQARLSIDENTGMIVKWDSNHCHDNDLAVQKVKLLVAKEVGEAANNLLVNPRSVHQKVAAQLMSDKKLAGSLAFLPNSSTMAKQIQYERRKSVKLPPVPKDWNFTLPPEFRKTSDSLDFIIGDSNIPGRQGRVLSFCSPTGMSLLANCDEVFGDGTFELTSCTMFSQLWVVCVKVKKVVIPCFYSFLPSKELVTYRVMFSHLKEAMGDTFPTVFHVDFESAVLRCIAETFPESHVQGCVVHFKR